MTWIAAAQPPFLAAVLAWSGGVKTAGRDARGKVAGTALHRLLGGRFAAPAYVALGIAEALLAFFLVATPGRLPALASALTAVGFLVYLTYSAVSVPEASCGCLGAGHTRVSWRGFARAGLMLAASVAAATSGVAWWTGLRPVGSTLLLAAEAAAFVALSAELDRYWLTPLRRAYAEVTHPLAGAPDVVPLQASIGLLLRSEAYKSVAPLLASDVLEHWEADGDWRILTYAVRFQGRAATAVFAVPLGIGGEPATVRVTIVDEEEVLAGV
jgi:hypothetical protein